MYGIITAAILRGYVAIPTFDSEKCRANPMNCAGAPDSTDCRPALSDESSALPLPSHHDNLVVSIRSPGRGFLRPGAKNGHAHLLLPQGHHRKIVTQAPAFTTVQYRRGSWPDISLARKPMN
jgi:hypothetical protein